MKINGKFGMFAQKYYAPTEKAGIQEVTPPPVIGHVYEYIPFGVYSEAVGEPTLGVFQGYSPFGPACFGEVEGWEKIAPFPAQQEEKKTLRRGFDLPFYSARK